MRTIIASIEAEYLRYKGLAEGTFAQLDEAQLAMRAGETSNSIATIVWHVSGNLASRFTDFLTTDGEKPWRQRDEEFLEREVTRAALLAKWASGWQVLFDTLGVLVDDDLSRTVVIRGQELPVVDALHRSLAHAASHVGQIQFWGKVMKGTTWNYLSIPPGGSAAYNANPTLERPLPVLARSPSPPSRSPMRHMRCALLGLFVTACTPSEKPADASPTAAPAPAASVMEDLLKDVGEVEQKLVDLSRAIPAAKYGYRPSAGVRSVSEVVMHVASDNYFMPAAAGTAAPAATGITGDNYETVAAFEKRVVSPDSAVKELQASFAFLKDAMKAQAPGALSEQKSMFGSTYTGQQVWIMATTHLHEHLGQMIAYARANNVVPPWSK